MGSPEPTVVYDLEDSITRVRLNRPEKRNAFNSFLERRPPRYAPWKGEPT